MLFRSGNHELRLLEYRRTGDPSHLRRADYATLAQLGPGDWAYLAAMPLTAETADGATVFVILISGFLVVGAMLLTEVIYQPPFWIHAALWLPIILIMTLGPLRPMKATLMALQYHHAAAEGRLTKVDRAS